MLDLNFTPASMFSGEIAAADSVTSTTTSTNNNNVCDEHDSNFSTLNFSILDRRVIEIDDDLSNGELELFPVSASSPDAAIRANYWLNLSAPAVPVTNQAEFGVYKAQLPVTNPVQQAQVKKSRRGPRSRSSQYRGVTFYRRTGRWESHIWDCGKQVYLGGFDTAHAAARAYDRAAIKFRGVDADINFSIGDYEEDTKQMKDLTKEEFVQILRRRSTGFARGSSKYRGVNLQKCGRWEAQVGQIVGKKEYDEAANRCIGRQALANFEPPIYEIERNIALKNGGGGSSLDLSLSISLASNGPQGDENIRNLAFSNVFYESPKGKRVKAETSSVTPHGVVMAKYSPVWAGMYSGYSPNNKEMSSGMSSEAPTPLSPLSNWPWKVQSHTPIPLLSSAASSGFSSNTAPYSGHKFPSIQ